MALASALTVTARAGPAMGTTNNAVTRDADDAGGAYASTANHKAVTCVAEEVAIATAATANNVLRGGFSTIAYYPGTLTSLSATGAATSSAALTWSTPGYDGTLGAALGGSAYLIFASSVSGGSLNFNAVTVIVSTSGQAVGSAVGAAATGLFPNTTNYAQVYLRDNDADVAFPFSTNSSTFVTLAIAPSTSSLTPEFVQITSNTVTVAWIAPSQVSIASQTNEGYILQASSNAFGALLPAGAPVFSSATFSALASTLTVGSALAPLNLGNTYYFQVASLNWVGAPNYTTLTRLNFEISQSTGLITIAMNAAGPFSVVSASSMTITNVGNWPATIQLSGTPQGPSPWTLGASRGIETAVLMGVFDPGPPAPASTAFSTTLTPVPISAQSFPGSYAGGAAYSGYQIPPGGSQPMWFEFMLPTTTVSLAPEVISVVSQPIYP